MDFVPQTAIFQTGAPQSTYDSDSSGKKSVRNLGVGTMVPAGHHRSPPQPVYSQRQDIVRLASVPRGGTPRGFWGRKENVPLAYIVIQYLIPN